MSRSSTDRWQLVPQIQTAKCVKKSNRICNKNRRIYKKPRDNKIMMMMLLHLLALPASRRGNIFFFSFLLPCLLRPVQRLTSLGDELSSLFYIRREKREREFKEQMIFDWNWIIEFFFHSHSKRSMVREMIKFWKFEMLQGANKRFRGQFV